MLGSVLPFNEETADRVSDYCEKRSYNIPDVLNKHWEYTRTHFSDADKMSSRLQGAWMIFTAQDRKPKRGTLHCQSTRLGKGFSHVGAPPPRLPLVLICIPFVTVNSPRDRCL